MRRDSLMLVRTVILVLLGGVVALLPAGPATAQVTPADATTCTGTVQVASFTFSPASVRPGQSSVATLVLQNCTAVDQQLSLVWYGSFTGTGTGVPQGCANIDPLPPLPVTVPASGRYSRGFSYQVPSSCTATKLTATVNINMGGTTVPTHAELAIGSAVPTCSVAYRRQSEWSGGFQASMTVTNTGSAAISGWTLVFAFGGDQVVTSAYNATVSQSGATVTAVNASYNGLIAPGNAVNFGIGGTWHASDAPPTTFRLNGGTCTTA
jgi:hypothetical protein